MSLFFIPNVWYAFPQVPYNLVETISQFPRSICPFLHQSYGFSCKADKLINGVGTVSQRNSHIINFVDEWLKEIISKHCLKNASRIVCVFLSTLYCWLTGGVTINIFNLVICLFFIKKKALKYDFCYEKSSWFNCKLSLQVIIYF